LRHVAAALGRRALKVLIVDDHALFRSGLRMLLATLNRAVICVEAASPAEARARIAEHPDIELCLLDLALRNETGLGVIGLVKDAAPQIAVVVVSGVDDVATIRQCIDAGAMSFIPKSAAPETLTQALRHVLAGEVFLPEQVATALDARLPAARLTTRQFQVLQALSRGLPTKLIARELSLSEHTVKEHIGGVLEALGARNRTEAVIIASRLGIGMLGAHSTA
jgi:DNA-binding NarL/FixJ family response regulator